MVSRPLVEGERKRWVLLVLGFFELCHSWYFLPLHLLSQFLLGGPNSFYNFCREEAVTSTNLEYSYFSPFFCPQVN